MSWHQLLLVGEAAPVQDPSWELVELSAANVRPKSSVILYKNDGRHIRADGARLVHTIVFYKNAKVRPLIIGRIQGGIRRGKATLEGDKVIVSTLENWGNDGVDVFRAFYDDIPLESQFTLRDPSIECTPEEIRQALR